MQFKEMQSAGMMSCSPGYRIDKQAGHNARTGQAEDLTSFDSFK